MKVYPETVKKICCYNKPRGKEVKDEQPPWMFFEE